jgi:hypothetical protein
MAVRNRSLAQAPHDPCGLDVEPSQAARVGSLWQAVRDAATELAAREPVLRRHMQQMVLERRSLADTMAAVLAERLAAADLDFNAFFM